MGRTSRRRFWLSTVALGPGWGDFLGWSLVLYMEKLGFRFPVTTHMGGSHLISPFLTEINNHVL